MHLIDYLIIILYLLALPVFGYLWKLKKNSSASEIILGGRVLTLPAFVASLVSTWYGGILGVGEYTYLYGISNWLVFGLPYYLAAFLFAFFMAKKARESELLTIPERLKMFYGDRTSMAGSIIIFLMTLPAAYILMLGVLAEEMLGVPFHFGVIGGAFFSVVYLFFGGFNSVVKTDIFQFFLMFIGFVMLLGFLISNYGGFGFLIENLPAEHLTWHGGNSGWYISIWYLIALSTLVEPSFYQRCYAAKDVATARKGIFISIGFWMFFDFLTTTTGLYARVLLPDLLNPVAAFPELAQLVLPTGLLGIFVLSLLATIMSTVDSYTFLAGTTFGYDILPRIIKSDSISISKRINIGILVSVAGAVLFALFFRSAIDIWHAFGSIGTPALLVPVLITFVRKKVMPAAYAFSSIIISGSISFVWYFSKYMTAGESYWFNLEPIFPGLLFSIFIFWYYSKLSSVDSCHNGKKTL